MDKKRFYCGCDKGSPEGDKTVIAIPDDCIAEINGNNIVISRIPVAEHDKWYVCIKDFYSGGCIRAKKGDVVQAKRGMAMFVLKRSFSEYFRPWTIKDAKTGDILKWNHCNAFIVFKDYCNEYKFNSYCVVGMHNFVMEEHEVFTDIYNIRPVTSEEKMLFFKRLDDEGYVWDANNLELRKRKWSIYDAKPGDVICDIDGNFPFIFKNVNKNGDPVHYVGMYTDGSISTINYLGQTFWGRGDGKRPATQEEKKLFMQKLDEAGYEWDAYNLELRKKKWIPKDGETFWYVYCLGDATFTTATSTHYIKRRFEDSTVFKTLHEAQELADELNYAVTEIFEKYKNKNAY